MSGHLAESWSEPIEAFDSWLSAWRQGGGAITEGVALARQREAVMRTLIQENPREALEQAVGFAEYAGLPEPVKEHIERPFSAQAELLVLPVCPSGRGLAQPSRVVTHELVLGDESFEASVFGRRAEIGSKQEVPLQGITLGRFAALREEVFQIIGTEDAGEFPEARPGLGSCFSSGRELGATAVVALAGGRVFCFADADEVGRFDARAARLELEPGPHSGSQAVFLMADGGAVDGAGFDWEAAEAEVELQASNWTENPKDVYFIRVDFSDLQGASIGQAELAGILNSTVDETIAAMSYGKTGINATVSPIVVRMPDPTTSYTPSSNTALHTAAKSAAEAQIAGLDLDAYDIVGVHFGDVGMGSGSLSSYAGLAGGSRQWLQDTSSSNVIIHEFGHNYGLGHASFWSTSDGSVVGAGASDEYGDDFDIMGDGSNDSHFHPQGKQKLNWLESGQWTDATAAGPGTYRIYRFDDPATSGSRRGVRITKAASPAEYYWLGYRKNLTNNPWLQSGIYLIWERPGYDRSWLLDTTPGSGDGRDDGAIVVGRTYSDLAAGVHITAIGNGGSAPDEWIDVAVNFGGGSSNVAPSAVLAGPGSGGAREPLTFSVSASDANGDSLAYYWDFGDGTVSENSASQTRSWLVGGTYTISVTVSDMKGGTVTRSQVVTVSDPLDSWIQRNSGTGADLFDITSDGSKLVAVGDGIYRTSVDGSSWSGGSLGVNVYARGVVHDGSQFLAAGQDYQFADPAGWRGVIHTSPDGSSWTRRHFTGARLRDIATSGSVHVAVGDDGEIWRSADGINWGPIASPTSIDLKGVSYGSGRFVAVGSGSPGNAGGPVVVLTSSDGSSWTDTSSGAGTSSWQGFYDVQFCNDRFLASGFYSDLRYSTDGGANFLTTRDTGEQIPAFAFGNGIYLAAGIDRDNSSANINLSSTDGENWGVLQTDASHAERNAAIFFADRFYTVGDDGEIWASGEIEQAPSGGTFAAWLEGFFPGSASIGAGLLDSDGDGLTNLEEYAGGSDPTLATSGELPSSAEIGGYLTLTVTKNPGVTDVAYLVEISTDLQNWDAVGTVVVSDDDDGLVVRSSVPLSSSGTVREFMRVRYTLVE
ncbi:MAG: PKD domain-containing protein [Verrucomicrobiales bacterium]